MYIITCRWLSVKTYKRDRYRTLVFFLNRLWSGLKSLTFNLISLFFFHLFIVKIIAIICTIVKYNGIVVEGGAKKEVFFSLLHSEGLLSVVAFYILFMEFFAPSFFLSTKATLREGLDICRRTTSRCSRNVITHWVSGTVGTNSGNRSTCSLNEP